MSEKRVKVKKGHDFSTKKKVSVWVSQHPYEDIPDEYFEETFTKNNKRATNTWSTNYNLVYFKPENMETNGVHEGTVEITQAAGECSFSASYMDVLMSKARKKKISEVTWLILLFEHEYSLKISGVEKDKYTTFLGAFNYDDAAENYNDLDEEAKSAKVKPKTFSFK